MKVIRKLRSSACQLRSATAILAWLLSYTAVPAQAPIGIGGVSDKAVYYDQASFFVTNQPGYTSRALLDSRSVPTGTEVQVTSVDYHELSVWQTNNSTFGVSNRVVRFIVSATARNGSEDGLPPWVPHVAIPSSPEEFAGAHLRLMLPAAFPADYPIPAVAWVETEQGHALRANGTIYIMGRPSIAIRRGAGSGFLSGTNPAGPLEIRSQLAGLEVTNLVQVETNTAWTTQAGTLSMGTSWPANSRIYVAGTLTNPAGSTLSIGAGSIVKIAPGTDIYNSGQIIINGSTGAPVVFMPAVPGQPWGGLIQHADNAALTAAGTIFTGSGANQGCWFTGHGCSSSLSGIGSHRAEQALISLKGANCNLALTDSAAISLAGQFGHSAGGVSGSYAIRLTRFLMQRCTTGGEYTDASFTVNDSAFIECPDDTRDFVDGDNDALYLVNGTHSFTNSLWGWTKDDGVDSGGSGAGSITFEGCWFESIFHEGNSLSGTGKVVSHFNSVFFDCGQGLEVGYDGPTGNLFHCLALGNLTGGRFGDNYPWSYSGFLRATNSLLLNNYRDVWGMNFQDWTWRVSAMDIQSNYLTAPVAQHPNNSPWQPEADGSRLAPFINTPPNAPVGVGLALGTAQLDISELTNGIPVRLSSFAPSAVSVDYAIEGPGQSIAAGTLRFVPGETLKTIPAATAPPGQDLVRLRISNPANARITGLATAWFARAGTAANTVLVPAGSVWKYLDNGTDAGTAWRAPTFDDSSWTNGPAELGYGDGGEAKVISFGPVSTNKYITYYFRHSFVVLDPAALGDLTVRLKRDDGGIVYLQGAEVFRSNITNSQVNYLTRALLASDDGATFFSTNVPAALLAAGTNVLAVEIHQESPTSSDISFDLQLEATPRPVLHETRFGADLLLVWADPAAVLEQSESLLGPWTALQGSSPAPMDLSAARKFYRLRQR